MGKDLIKTSGKAIKSDFNHSVHCASRTDGNRCVSAASVKSLSCVRVLRPVPLVNESPDARSTAGATAEKLAWILSDPVGRLAWFAAVLVSSWAAGIVLGEVGFWLARK